MNHKIIVGVDYGTTYTGVSYVSTDKSDINDILVISSWPGPSRDMETVLKVPSRIAYPFNNPNIQENKWGFQVEGNMTGYSWTKLLLDHSTDVTEFDDTILEPKIGMGIFKLPEGKDATAVATDFLTRIYKHTMFVLERQISAGALAITPIEFWFTIPAIWPDQAQRATRDAAMEAGFASRPNDQIFMISEPEAAAIATLKKSTTATSLRAPIEPGDGVLVCDCGGGTVDITTYLVSDIYPKLVFEELCTGIGAKCGSTSIDRRLHKLMLKRFGRFFDDLVPKKKGPGSEFMKAFEQVKRDFGYSDEDRVYELPLNINARDVDPEFFDDDERLVKTTSKDVQQLFEPVVDRIIALVKRQLTAANAEVGRSVIKYIILVGGFGDSEYLRKVLVQEFTEPMNVQVIVSESPQAAIVKGATLRGLEGTRPTSKRCRRHYGFSWCIDFRKGIDAEEDSCVDFFDGSKTVSGIMNWSIKKGERILEDTIRETDVRHREYGWSPSADHLKLHASSLDDAPERVDHPRVDVVGTIKCDFTNISPEKVKTKINHEGKKVCAVDYKLQVLLGTKEGILRFQCVIDGDIVGKADIDFAES